MPADAIQWRRSGNAATRRTVRGKEVRLLLVKGHEAELRSTSEEFGGHCLALTLLGSYLSDAYMETFVAAGEVSGHLAQDARQA